MFTKRYGDVFKGDKNWQGIKIEGGQTYGWDSTSTYVQNPPYFEDIKMTPDPVTDIVEARVLAIFGDSITTDHISPASTIRTTSPAGQYLIDRQVSPNDFNGYGARRGNHQVMMRGTFANIRIRNRINPDIEGGVTKHFPSGDTMAIYDAAMRYQAEGRPMVVFAGKEYGTGSSRDWAAKGTRLLGVRAVIAESFERIHRSNLVGMGVLPLQFKVDGWQKLGLTGEEIVSIRGMSELSPRRTLTVELYRPSEGRIARIPVICRIDTPTELDYFRAGGVLNYVLRNLARGVAAYGTKLNSSPAEAGTAREGRWKGTGDLFLFPFGKKTESLSPPVAARRSGEHDRPHKLVRRISGANPLSIGQLPRERAAGHILSLLLAGREPAPASGPDPAGAGRAVHQPGLRGLREIRRSDGRSGGAPARAGPDLRRRLLGLSGLARQLRQARVHRPPARLSGNPWASATSILPQLVVGRTRPRPARSTPRPSTSWSSTVA